MSVGKVLLWLQQIASHDAREPLGIKGFKAFNGLRGYMAWWVVIGHALFICGLDTQVPVFLSRVGVAVNVFICLSGFVITHLLLEKSESYPKYLTRRAFRIFPIYWFALLCALALGGAYQFLYHSEWIGELPMRVARQASTDEHFATHLLLHLGLLHGLVPDTWLPYSASSLLAPAWSLSLEWQFYLVAPLLVGYLARPGWSRIASLTAMAVLWIAFKKLSPLEWQYPAFLPLTLHFFALGILSRAFMPLLSRLHLWIVPLAIAASFVMPRSVSLEVAIWGVFLCAASLELRHAQGEPMEYLSLQRLLRSLTSNRSATALGECSYSTYLIHIPLFSLFGWLTAQVTGAWTQAICMVSITLAVITLVPVSALLYRYLERPFIQVGARMIPPRRPVLSTD